jgi:hypothetical protein
MVATAAEVPLAKIPVVDPDGFRKGSIFARVNQ